MEDVVLGVGEAEQFVFLFFFDGEVAADGEIDDGGSDVAHVDGIIHERADFAGSEFVRRLVLCGDGTQAGIAAAGPPPPEHQEESDDREKERPIAAEIEEEDGEGGGFADGAFVEGDSDGEAFMHGKRAAGLHVHAGADDFNCGIGARGAIRAREGFGAEIGGGCGKNDVRARGFDGDGPLVAGDIPIELVVIVEEFQGVGNGVVD